mmetsp:Transcript_4487/g.10430  ORF Transcript_4487/g.10430 Transcript_4487/m.10430 type:complete len:201 (-) Transcript_4487:144-746(-)
MESIIDVGNALRSIRPQHVVLQSIVHHLHGPVQKNLYDLTAGIVHKSIHFGVREQTLEDEFFPLLPLQVPACEPHEEGEDGSEDVLGRQHAVLFKFPVVQGHRQFEHEQESGVYDVHTAPVQVVISAVAMPVVEGDEEGHEELDGFSALPGQLADCINVKVYYVEDAHGSGMKEKKNPELKPADHDREGGFLEFERRLDN